MTTQGIVDLIAFDEVVRREGTEVQRSSYSIG